jgi:co-chaperonin GroES (HSP10)
MSTKDLNPELIVPEHLKRKPKEALKATPGSVNVTTEDTQESAQDDPVVASMLPEPKGYRLLIALPEVKDTTDGGIFKGEEEIRAEEVGTICGFVLKMGDTAYTDKRRFPTGPWCKIGDWVMFRAYTGTRFKINNKEFRLINDDTVEAVVDDPRGIVKA